LQVQSVPNPPGRTVPTPDHFLPATGVDHIPIAGAHLAGAHLMNHVWTGIDLCFGRSDTASPALSPSKFLQEFGGGMHALKRSFGPSAS